MMIEVLQDIKQNMSTILRLKKECEQNMNGNGKIYKQIKE